MRMLKSAFFWHPELYGRVSIIFCKTVSVKSLVKIQPIVIIAQWIDAEMPNIGRDMTSRDGAN